MEGPSVLLCLCPLTDSSESLGEKVLRPPPPWFGTICQKKKKKLKNPHVEMPICRLCFSPRICRPRPSCQPRAVKETCSWSFLKFMNHLCHKHSQHHHEFGQGSCKRGQCCCKHIHEDTQQCHRHDLHGQREARSALSLGMCGWASREIQGDC